jgi:hypothetical protein
MKVVQQSVPDDLRRYGQIKIGVDQGDLNDRGVNPKITGLTDATVITTAIQTALNNVSSIGGKVILPSGTFNINDTLVIPINCSLVGNGSSTKLIMTNANKHGVQLTDGSRLTDLYIQLPVNAQAHAIYVGTGTSQVKRWFVNNVEVKGFNPYKTTTDIGTALYIPDGTTGFAYYGFVDGLKVVETYKGIYIGVNNNSNFITGLRIENPAHGLDVKGDGNTIQFLNQTGSLTAHHVTVSGKQNEFDGFIWDLYQYGSTSVAYEFSNLSYGNLVINKPGSWGVTDVIDSGQKNRISDSFIKGTFPRGQNPASSYNPSGNTPYYMQPEMSGLQDDCLANAPSWATVTTTGTIIANVAATMFDYTNNYALFSDPSINNIVITIDLTSNPIFSANIIGIAFANKATAKNIKIEQQNSSGGAWSTLYNNANNTSPRIILNPSDSGSTLYGLRFTITQAIGDANMNPNNQIGISHIFCTGLSPTMWLPRSGGAMYGNLNMGSFYLKVFLLYCFF